MEYICRVWGKQIKIIGWFLEMEKKKKKSEETEVQYGADGCYRIFRGDTRGRNTFEPSDL